MSNATYEKLRSMRLGAMAEAYKQQLSDPEICNLSFEDVWLCLQTLNGQTERTTA